MFRIKFNMSARLISSTWMIAFTLFCLLPLNCSSQERGGLFPIKSLRPTKGAILFEWERPILPSKVDLSLLDKGLEDFASGFYLDKPFSTLHVEADGFLAPGLFFGEITVDWEKVLTESGKNILDVSGKKQRRALPFHKGVWKGEIPIMDQEDDPVSAVGQATIRVPTRFTHFSLSGKDLKKELKKEGITLKLKRLEGDIFILQSQNADEHLFHYFVKDAQGRYLKTVSAWAMKIAGKTTHELKAYGEIEEIEIFITQDWLERKMQVTVSHSPKSEEINRAQLKSTRYGSPQKPLDFEILEEQSLAKKINFITGWSISFFGPNEQTIRVQFPAIDNSYYAHAAFAEPKLLDKNGNEVPFSMVKGINSVRISPLEGDEPVQFSLVHGQVQVTYPLEIDTLRIGPAEKKNGFHFEGHWVYFTSKEPLDYIFSPFGPRSVRAYDKTGRELKMLSNSSFSNVGDGQQIGRAFWGDIDHLKVDWVTRWTNLNLSYKLPSPPMPDGP